MTVGTDADLVRGWVARQSDCLESAVSRYADELLLCAGWLIGQEEAAQDAVRATFVRATRHIGGLADSARLRTWLFAILRNECLLRPAPLDRVVPLDVRLGENSQVWLAARALDRSDREIFALHVCAGLDATRTGEVLGVRLGNATVRIARMKRALRRCLTLLDLAQHGTGCDRLREIVVDPAVPLTADLRARLDQHAGHCAVCRAIRTAPEDVLGGITELPVGSATAALLTRIGADCRAAEDVGRTRPAWTWRPDGFPEGLDARSGAAPLGLSWVALGGVALAVLLVVAAVFGGVRAWAGGVPAAQTQHALPLLARTPVAATTSPPASAMAGAAPTPTAGRSLATVRPAPPSARIALSPAAVKLGPAAPAATVRLVVTGKGRVTWQARLSTRGARVTPASGTAAAGTSVRLTLQLTGSKVEGIFDGNLLVTTDSDAASTAVSAAVLYAPKISSVWIYPHKVAISGRKGCAPRTVAIGAAVRDDSGVAIVAVWSPDGKSRVTTSMPSWKDHFRGSVGPFTARAGGQVVIKVTDELGSQASTSLRVSVVTCH